MPRCGATWPGPSRDSCLYIPTAPSGAWDPEYVVRGLYYVYTRADLCLQRPPSRRLENHLSSIRPGATDYQSPREGGAPRVSKYSLTPKMLSARRSKYSLSLKCESRLTFCCPSIKASKHGGKCGERMLGRDPPGERRGTRYAAKGGEERRGEHA